ncbi:Low temperature viability protein-domain-containing protein [Dichotomocladium elegans]|nr:Low temperature viability protein-domain-containing protein [Dichotomocladium elegans]
MGKKDFIDRKTAKHFHVVHRSQRDPLINDPEAPDRVLKEYIPGNLQKHKTQQEINAIKQKPVQLSQDEIDSRVTFATQQGIYFDDVGEYDYSQHLRIIGSATESVFLEAPKREEKKKHAGALQFKDSDDNKGNDETKRRTLDLPADVLPSEIERDVGAVGQLTGLEGGLQPDMDPRLREILEALDDEEYVEEDADDDFFAELNAEGAQYEPEEDEEDEFEEEIEENGNYNWEAAFRNFKRGKQRGGSSDEEDDDDLLERRTKGTSFSVSSSVMHRNAQLTLLDDRFDKIEEEYMRDEESDEDYDAPDLEDRADFENILDDFLDKYEIVGRKMAFKLDGDTGGEKLDTIRQSLGGIRLDDDQDKPKVRKQDIESIDLWERPKKHRETWDCQSVLSTYSNLENHPAIISDRGMSKKIIVNPKTGMPTLVEKPAKPRIQKGKDVEEEDNDGSDDDADDGLDDGEERVNLGAARTKGESKEEKKARKAAVKEAKKVIITNVWHE